MQDFLAGVRRDKQKLVMVVVFFAAFLYIDFSFILKAQVEEKTLIASKVAKLQIDIQNVERDVSMMQHGVKKEVAFSKTKRIFSEGELLSLLGDISLIAKTNSVRVAQINPQKGARLTQEGQSQTDYLPVFIKLDLTCNYHSLGVFLNELENADFPVSTEDIRITPDLSAGQKERVLLTLKTYVKS